VARASSREGFGDLVADVQQFAEASAAELGPGATDPRTSIERTYANLAGQYPELSIAVVPVGAPVPGLGTAPVLTAGAWRHDEPPAAVPPWVALARRFAGTLVSPPRAGRSRARR
jgi:hypothetical protein